MLLDQREDLRVGDEPALDDLAQPGPQLGVRQRAEEGQVAQHAGRLVEGTDQVLPGTGVDAGLAADRGVDHAEQRRRDVHDPHPAEPGRGHEPAQVGGRSPTDGDDGIAAREAGAAERLPALRRHDRRLGLLAVGHRQRQHVVRRGEGVADRTAAARPSGATTATRVAPRPTSPGRRSSRSSPTTTSYGAPVATRITVGSEATSLTDDLPDVPSTAEATSCGVRPSVSTTAVATDS